MFFIIAKFVTKFWMGILIVAVLLTGFSIMFACKIELDTDIMHLLPTNNKVVNDFHEAAEVFDFNNNLIVVIEKNGTFSDAQVEKFTNEFAILLGESTLIRKIDHKLPKVSFNKNAARIEDKFNVTYKPYRSQNEDAFLMFISPEKPSKNIKFSGEVMREVRNIERQVRKNNKELSELKINYTGGYVITLEESKSMERNVKVMVVVSFVCVFLFFFIVFKRVDIGFYVSIPLVMAVIWIMSVAFFVVGSLNMLTIAFAAILAGLGVDFGIHIYNRYLFEVSSGKSVVMAVQNTIVTTGESIFYSCITTSLAFFSLFFTDFRGASEFGLLIGTGIIICLITMIFVLPALLILGEKIGTKYNVFEKELFNLDYLADKIQKYGKGIAGLCCAFALVYGLWALLACGMPQFDNGLETMSSQGNHAIKLQKDLLAKFGNCYEPIVVYAKGKDPNKNVKNMEEITSKARKLKENGVITRYESIFKYCPSSGEKGQLVSSILGERNAERCIEILLEKLKNDETKQDEYDFLLKKKSDILFFANSEKSSEGVTYAELKKFLPEVLLSKFFAEGENEDYYSVLYVYLPNRIVTEAEKTSLKESLGIDTEDIKLTGVSFMIRELESKMKTEIRNILLVVGVVLFLVLIGIYRKLTLAFISVVPLLFGICVTIAFMVSFNIKLNYMNIIAFPLILGMGIDDGIHMIHRYFENDTKNIGVMIKQTGRAVLLTSLTTMIGFGSLLLSKHNGLISLGIITVVGIGACLFASLFVLPGLLMLVDKKV